MGDGLAAPRMLRPQAPQLHFQNILKRGRHLSAQKRVHEPLSRHHLRQSGVDTAQMSGKSDTCYRTEGPGTRDDRGAKPVTETAQYVLLFIRNVRTGKSRETERRILEAAKGTGPAEARGKGRGS